MDNKSYESKFELPPIGDVWQTKPEIVALIPLKFGIRRYFGSPSVPIDEKSFTKGFLDSYEKTYVDYETIYVIKEDLFINNYKSFLNEFCSLIDGMDFVNCDSPKTHVTFDNIPQANDMDEFSQMYSRENRNRKKPYACDDELSFSVSAYDCMQYWMFYGSGTRGKLDEYQILFHFEKVLAKTMKNPLSNAIKFGFY